MDLPETQKGPFGDLPVKRTPPGQRLALELATGYQTPCSKGGHTWGKCWENWEQGRGRPPLYA